jgi:uncharacterized protein (TIGR02449 family)
MIEKNLLSLQALVDSLVGSHSQLAAENDELHKRLEIMQQKNAALLHKKEEAFSRLRGILTQIKEGALCP